MKVKKAVILAAGLGTRMLPATKAVPKEMLTLVDKPAVQYITEELAASGIEDVLVVVSRGKEAVQNHLDGLVNAVYVRQPEMKGTGNAVLYARSFAGSDPFVVIYPDDIMVAASDSAPVTAQICRAFEAYGLGAVAMKEFSDEDIVRLSSLDAKPLENNIHNNIHKVTDMVEKPQLHEVFTNFSILGRCVLPAKIFAILEETKPGLGGEIWLTDAMKQLARSEGMLGVDFKGVRYDTGNKLGFLKAVTELGLAHDETGAEYRRYLKELMNT
jgi:UTP--glucose-1-phosphate uridylyltransferase